MTDPSPRGFIIAAPRSGSGKTAVTLGIARALTNAGYRVAPAKTGPDYIDPAFLSRAAQADAGEVETGSPFAAATQKSTAAINLDPWAMDAKTLTARAAQHAERHDILLIEGVMGLFDSAIDGKGSTADLAATLDLPVILVVDCDRQAQSVAALVHGFASWRNDVTIAGIILNKVASDRHETMLRDALAKTAIPCLGAIPRRADLALPERHLGLVLPGDIEGIEDHLARAGSIMTTRRANRQPCAAGPAHRHRPRRGLCLYLPPPARKLAQCQRIAELFFAPGKRSARCRCRRGFPPRRLP